MKRFWILPILAIIAGCVHGNGQVPPSTHSATLTVTNSPCAPGTAAATCGYVFSSAITSGACPSTAGTNYTPINQGTPVAQPATGSATFTDTSAAGETVCYIAQTCEAGKCFQPSSAAGPATVQPNPTAPSLGAPTVATNEKPKQIPTTPFKEECAGVCVEVAVNSPVLQVKVR